MSLVKSLLEFLIFYEFLIDFLLPIFFRAQLDLLWRSIDRHRFWNSTARTSEHGLRGNGHPGTYIGIEYTT